MDEKRNKKDTDTTDTMSTIAQRQKAEIELIQQHLNESLERLKSYQNAFDSMIGIPHIEFTARYGETNLAQRNLTPSYLATVLNPYLIAISAIQAVINQIHGHGVRSITIKFIKQNSPISVSLDGASETIQTIKEIVVPWRRKHSELMAKLIEQEKVIEIESKKADILEKHALAKKTREEANKLSAEVEKQNNETEKIRLENEKLRLEINKEKFHLAMEVLAHIAPNLSEGEKHSYIVKLLEPLNELITNELEISSE